MSEIHEITVLGGEDVNRHPSMLVVEVINGRPCDPYTGQEITVCGHHKLLGWGMLSGDAYTLSNGVDVPVENWPW